MRIHSDVLSLSDFYSAVKGLPGVYMSVSQHGSRSHAAAFELSPEGNGYRKNTGTQGAGDVYGATWDEWGVVFAHLFDIDPEALAGSVKHPAYKNGYHFHEITGDRFEAGKLPEDTHKRHNWTSSGVRAQACKKCSAVRVY